MSMSTKGCGLARYLPALASKRSVAVGSGLGPAVDCIHHALTGPVDCRDIVFWHSHDDGRYRL